MLKKETGKKKKNIDKKDLKVKSKNRSVSFVLVFILFLVVLGAFGIVYLGKNYESVSRSNIKLSETKDFKFVSDLSVGDTLFEDKNSSNVSPIQIVDIDKEYKNETVYNFTASNGSHTYLANGFAVHNKEYVDFSTVELPYGSTNVWDDTSGNRLLPAADGTTIYQAFTDDRCTAYEDATSQLSKGIPGLSILNFRSSVTVIGQYTTLPYTSSTVVECKDDGTTTYDSNNEERYIWLGFSNYDGDYRPYGINPHDNERNIIVYSYFKSGLRCMTYDQGWSSTVCHGPTVYPPSYPALYDPIGYTDGVKLDYNAYAVPPPTGSDILWTSCGVSFDQCHNNNGSGSYDNRQWRTVKWASENGQSWIPERDGLKTLSMPSDESEGYQKNLWETFTFDVDATGTYMFLGNNPLWEWVWVYEDGQSPNSSNLIVDGNADRDRSGTIDLDSNKTYKMTYRCMRDPDHNYPCGYAWGKMFSGNSDVRLGVVRKTPPPCEIVPSVICKNDTDNYTIDTTMGVASPGQYYGVINNVQSLNFHDWSMYAPQGTINSDTDHDSGSITLRGILSAASDIPTGQVRYNYNDSALRCSANYAVYPNPDVLVNVKSVLDCNSAVSASNPEQSVNGVSVQSVNTLSVITDGVDGNFYDIPVIDTENCSTTNTLSCSTDCSLDTYFRIDTGQNSLATNGYEACPFGSTLNGNWESNGNLYSTDPIVSASAYNDQTLNFYVRQVLPDVQTPSWISIDKGNYTVVANDFTMSSDGYGVYDDTLVSELGSVFSETSPISGASGALTNGDVGPLAPSDTNKVYVYDGEGNSNNIATKLTDYLNDHDILPTNVVQRNDCTDKGEVASADTILYYSGCAVDVNLELNASDVDTLYGSGNLKMLIVEQDLIINSDVDAIPFPVIVKGDLYAN